jgi:hypothetical protein
MYNNLDDVHDLFVIAASKEQRSQPSSRDFSKVIGHEAAKAEGQAVDRLPKEFLWISDGITHFGAVLAGSWKT